MSVPPDPPEPPDPSEPTGTPEPEPISREFFPPSDPLGEHTGIPDELEKPEINPRIRSEDDYRRALALGFRRARDFLFGLPFDPSRFGAHQISLVHQLFFFGLYRDAGAWATVNGTFGGKIGADPGSIAPELDKLSWQAGTLFAGWRHQADTEAGLVERLAYLAFCHARIVYVHPFRDGNGRVSRLIAAWQELCIFGPEARRAVPRAVYMKGLKEAHRDLALLINYFGYRHPQPTPFLQTYPPLYPVQVTLR